MSERLSTTQPRSPGQLLAHQIKIAMAVKEVSQTELAKRIGTDPSFVSKLLKGKGNPSIETLVKVFFALGYHIHIGLEDAQKGGAA